MTAPPDHPAIEARGVSFAYPDAIAALIDVDFAAAPAEFVAVVGANGSGKTTLMKVLMRLLRPQAGRVLLAGRPIDDIPAAELYARVGMVFQNPADQLFAATVEQDVAFGPRNLGLDEAEVARRVAESLAAVDAAALADRPIHHLSFGEQKRACLAGVLAMRPRALVLDEPTAGLDPAGEAQMIELLTRLNREQRITVVLATHAVDLLPPLANRIYVLSRGRVVRSGRPEDIFADPASSAEAGLRLPLVAQLFDGLGGRNGHPPGPLPLTIEQARARLLEWLAAARPTEGPP